MTAVDLMAKIYENQFWERIKNFFSLKDSFADPRYFDTKQ